MYEERTYGYSRIERNGQKYGTKDKADLVSAESVPYGCDEYTAQKVASLSCIGRGCISSGASAPFALFCSHLKKTVIPTEGRIAICRFYFVRILTKVRIFVPSTFHFRLSFEPLRRCGMYRKRVDSWRESIQLSTLFPYGVIRRRNT